MLIRKAQRKKAKLRLGIAGISGSGKTWSALTIATGMGGKIGLIDTEAGRAELYGDDFNYDVIRLDAPFSPERYIQAIKSFEDAGYDIIIIDSLSHAWVGDGGVLSIAENAQGTNKFTSGWKIATPKQNALINKIVTSKAHIITTFRVKTEYVLEINDKGKSVPRKVGLTPVQRDGVDYEFTLFMDMSNEHIAHITKDNTHLYDGQFIKPTLEMGKELIMWLNSGVEEINDYENFILNIMPKIIDDISNAQNIIELKNIYMKAHQDYAQEYSKAFGEIVIAKDERKIALDNVPQDAFAILQSAGIPVTSLERGVQ